LKHAKQAPHLQHVNATALQGLDPGEVLVKMPQVEAAEADDVWSFVEKKSQQRWLWHASDHRTGVVLAYALGTHQDDVF
jgi:insertion element IS1 protein InsB